MSEELRDQLTSQIVASIRRMTDEQLGQLIRSQCADEAALRAECERLKATRVPNVDSLSKTELNGFIFDVHSLKLYAERRSFGMDAEQWYAALPPWAKFRGEE